jgi:hypothetical protein
VKAPETIKPINSATQAAPQSTRPEAPTERTGTKGRAPRQIVIIGTNGTGKSTFAKKLIANELKKKDSHVLIVVPDDLEYPNIPYVHPKFTHRIATYVGARKVIYEPGLLDNIGANFRNGMVHFEDCRAYFRASLDESLHSLLIRRRQKMLDIMVVGHGFTEIPPKFFTFATTYVLFKTIDQISRRRDCIQNFDVMAAAQARVNERARTNPHYYEVINV